MICPVHDLGMHAWSNTQCTPNSVFIWRTYEAWPPLNAFVSSLVRIHILRVAQRCLKVTLFSIVIFLQLRLENGIPAISYTTFQLHCLVLASFASLVAPFGGFFASGFKRAFNLKDFGDSIPGHGGMTDRMDCQYVKIFGSVRPWSANWFIQCRFLMGMFSYVYYSALVREHHVTVGSVLQTVVSSLTVEEQIELFHDLKRYLDGMGVTGLL